MNLANNIEKLIRDSRVLDVNTNAEMDQRILDDALKVQKKYKNTKMAPTRPIIWRTIMKNKITKSAAAVIILVIIGIFTFNGTVSIDTPVFAQISENMKIMPWVHFVNKNSSCNDEGWLSFTQQIEINKKASGKITYEEYDKKLKYVYDPGTKTITLTDISHKIFALGTSNPLAFIEAYLDREKARGAELIRRNGLYNEKPVEIWKMTRTEGNWSEELSLFIDLEKHLLLAAEVKSGDRNKEPSYVGNITFDYPQDGPQDIYALGAPKGAKVVDLLPKTDALKALRVYQKYRDAAPSAYAAVVIFDTEEAVRVEENVFGFVTIIYRDGQRQSGWGYKILGTADEYAAQIGDTFESAMKWCRKSNLTKLNVVDLFTGVYHYQSKYNSDYDKWDIQPRKDYPDHLDNYLEILRHSSWPRIISRSRNSATDQIHIVKNEYAEKYGLICIERLRQGIIYTKKDGKYKAMPPIRELYYLNPHKDYICQRLEHYRRQNAPWQKDKSWLDGLDPNSVRPDATGITQITEYGQTDSGKWYPKVVTRTIVGVSKDETPGVFTTTNTIYLKIAPEFPKGIFDPENLPR